MPSPDKVREFPTWKSSEAATPVQAVPLPNFSCSWVGASATQPPTYKASRVSSSFLGTAMSAPRRGTECNLTPGSQDRSECLPWGHYVVHALSVQTAERASYAEGTRKKERHMLLKKLESASHFYSSMRSQQQVLALL
ncbi:hypothetical protein NDU88_003214 [Pleurodeles waltl]|uniref:Uncharacterized protein n=1 Tax=Pleurodeles waltl TaxID=8319 RepID=A0AAV7TMY6_PLEWA|nr:hypothetical protein NDU88_003214 [Pleurodeles waltl]